MNNLKEVFKGKKVLLVSHTDLDGIGCYLVFNHFLGSETKIVTVLTGYEKDFSDLESYVSVQDRYDYVVFTDFSPSEWFLENWQNKESIYIIDHHLTAFDTLKDVIPKERYYFDETKCGAMLCYEALKGDKLNNCIKELIQLINVYDMWDKENPLWDEATNLNALLFESVYNWGDKITNFVRYKYFINNMNYKINHLDNFSFTDKDRINIQKYKTKQINSYRKSLKTKKIREDSKGNKYLYFEAPSKLSYICDRYLNELKEIKYVVARSSYWKAVKERKLSVRSQGDFDVRQIVESFGMGKGGGHKNACGLKIEDLEVYEKVINGQVHLA